MAASRRLTVVLAVAIAGTFGAPAAIAQSGSLSLTAEPSLVTYGASTHLSGTLVADGACIADRPLELEWHPAGQASFSTIASGATGPDGSYTFDPAQGSSGRYRVTAPASAHCDVLESPDVPVRVRALVQIGSGTASVEPGGCLDIGASVAPPKPGQSVVLQRKSTDGWIDVDALVLDAASQAIARPCFGSEDAPRVRLRFRWPSQDDLNATGTSATIAIRVAEAGWMERIDVLVAGRSVSVSVAEAGTPLYEHGQTTPRTPASNEKLVLSMALLHALGPEVRFATRAAAQTDPAHGAVHGDLWILGRGDPEVDGHTMRRLATAVASAGISRVDGSVMGGTTYFGRDWIAPGWNDAAHDYVARPTALVFDGNLDRRGRHVADPERRAAEALTRALRSAGVRVERAPGSGVPPSGLTSVASVRSRPLRAILARMLRPSDNFIAEVLGKRLGVEQAGTPGTIAKGAAAIDSFAAENQVEIQAFDSSGLSYDDRVTADAIVHLLRLAETAPWGRALFQALPRGGQGTLEHRLLNVEVHAKTGTLTGISALSGWVWLERSQTWGEFSILSSGMSKDTASEIEDRIVRILQNQAS